MNILITGGTGFIGNALIPRLRERGDSLVVYTRQEGLNSDAGLSYVNDLDEIAFPEHLLQVASLAGESIAGGRWTERRKHELLESRIGTTRALYALACRLEQPPETVLSASAIGYYGPQDDHPLGEDADTVDCFSHRLCVAWEDAARKFEELGARVCLMRLGVVLGKDGGAFEQLKQSVQFGVATYLGSGKQWLSWVHRDDVIAAIEFLLDDEGVSGPVNVTAPEPVTNRGFCESLREHRTGFIALPVPAFVMKAALGQMAEELLLTGQRVLPRRLEASGFAFRYPTLAEALPTLLAS